ncbi:MAG: hypothetical protein HPY58_05935 [Firmicutes bacterium]|nr:hypothetical protein [Bacillota bacterium]
MNGTWHHEVRQVLRLDEEELALWERIAESVPTHHLRHMIRMMIRREQEEMAMLRMLLGESCYPGPDYGPDPGSAMDTTTCEEKK